MITEMTFVTLTILCLASASFLGWLFCRMADHDKIQKDRFNKPLKNVGKPWYND